MEFTTVICIIVALVLGLLLGWLFFGSSEKLSRKVAQKVSSKFDYKSCAKSINHEIALENDSLTAENENLKEKIEFFRWLFIRQFIVEYEKTLLRAGNHMIFTSDALQSMRAWAEVALRNYQDVWGGKPYNDNHYCEWTEEFLEYLINWVQNIQEDEWAFDYIDPEYEAAFLRFFEYFNNTPSFDRANREHNHETTELVYCHPQGRCGFVDES